MLHLGILAHSTEGAALCFRAFTQQGFSELGPHAHPDVTMDCIALSRSMPYWDSGEYGPIRDILMASIDRLARAGADFFVCPDNTAHMALDLAGGPFAIPGLHIAEVVAEHAARDGRHKVGILGTSYTMNASLYPEALAREEIEAQLPVPKDREIINAIIFEELLDGKFTAASRREFLRIIEEFANRGCDAVALVCTEIPLLITPEVSSLPTLDSTRLLARAAFEVAMGQRRPRPTWRGGLPEAVS